MSLCVTHSYTRFGLEDSEDKDPPPGSDLRKLRHMSISQHLTIRMDRKLEVIPSQRAMSTRE